MKALSVALLVSLCVPACVMDDFVDDAGDYDAELALGEDGDEYGDEYAAALALADDVGEDVGDLSIRDEAGDAVGDVAAFATTSSVAVTMKHVRYCTKRFLGVCTKSTTPSEFSAWQSHDVKDSRQKETYLAKLGPSNPSAIENIVFLSAGQQGLDATFTDSTTNVLTGQPGDYRSQCKGTCFSKTVYLDGRSLAARLMGHPTFSTSNTLYVLVFDAQFNFNYGADAKMKVERAFDSYLQGLVDNHRIQRIILGGSSRGGALVFRLAHRMLSNNTYPNAKIITEGFDAVFVQNQELGSTSFMYDNPLNSGSYKGRFADVGSYFAPYGNRFASAQIVGGQEVVIITGARGAVYQPWDVDYGWWSQRWVDMKHTDIGRDYNSPHTLPLAYEHILLSMSRLGM
ncbi:MAG: hypothetical protein Tsb0020_11620 [Haliangiales bacterium]